MMSNRHCIRSIQARKKVAKAFKLQRLPEKRIITPLQSHALFHYFSQHLNHEEEILRPSKHTTLALLIIGIYLGAHSPTSLSNRTNRSCPSVP